MMADLATEAVSSTLLLSWALLAVQQRVSTSAALLRTIYLADMWLNSCILWQQSSSNQHDQMRCHRRRTFSHPTSDPSRQLTPQPVLQRRHPRQLRVPGRHRYPNDTAERRSAGSSGEYSTHGAYGYGARGSRLRDLSVIQQSHVCARLSSCCGWRIHDQLIWKRCVD